ncbi:MAG: aminotransferase class V-fold PLP-dependent enzyme [Pseudomonadota bacterium]
MPLANGRPFLAIPGPSVFPDEVLQAMHRPGINIYEGPLIEMTHTIIADLKKVARGADYAMIYISNGHGGWEAAVSNTLDPGDKALVLDTGRFAVGWAEIASTLGAEPEMLSAAPRRPIDPQAVEDRLRADTSHEIKSVLVCQIDTATGILNDIPAIRAAMDAARHPALLQVDCMASLGCVPFEMKDWGVDVTIAGSQKGLMTPPGLGLVWASEKAWEHSKTLTRGRAHWDWLPRGAPEVYYQHFHGTAPVQHLFGLRKALDMMLAETMEAIWARHATLAKGVRAAVAHWGSAGPMEFNVLTPEARSDAVTTILTGEMNANTLRAIAEEKLGVTLGIGLGMDPETAFRIGHMGHVNAPMILGTLGAVELSLSHMGADYAPGGVEAAIVAMKDGVA